MSKDWLQAKERNNNYLSRNYSNYSKKPPYFYLDNAKVKNRIGLHSLDSALVKYYQFSETQMTWTSFVFTELANTVKYEGGILYNLVFTE